MPKLAKVVDAACTIQACRHIVVDSAIGTTHTCLNQDVTVTTNCSRSDMRSNMTALKSASVDAKTDQNFCWGAQNLVCQLFTHFPRSPLISFLWSYEGHPQTCSCRPTSRDRRSRLLEDWWCGPTVGFRGGKVSVCKGWGVL